MFMRWNKISRYTLLSGMVVSFWLFYRSENFNLLRRLISKLRSLFPLFIKNNFLNNEIKNSVKIYFGSQSGTAEEFAKELKANLNDLFHIQANIIDLEYFNKEEIKSFGIRIFIVATYGDGEPTDNAVEFFKWLKSLNNDNDYFRNTKYSIMGLGSKQYKHFNKIAKKLDTFLLNFKAHQISETIYGDDDDNIYHDFEVWKNKFFMQLPKLLNMKNIPIYVPKEDIIELTSWRDMAEIKLDIQYYDHLIEEDNKKEKNVVTENIINESVTNNQQLLNHNQNNLSINNKSNYISTDIIGKFYFNHLTGKVISNTKLLKNVDLSNNGDKVNHINISIEDNIIYKAADNLSILTKNTKEVITWWLKRLNIDEKEKTKKFTFVKRNKLIDNSFTMNDPKDDVKNETFNNDVNKGNNKTNIDYNSNNNGNNNNNNNYNEYDDNHIYVPFPTPCSVEDALSYYCDLTTIPRLNILKKFKCFIKDIEELKMFNFILSNNQRNTFFNICKECDMTFIEFVDMFMQSAVFELSPFLQLIPRNTPKSYTISSSPKESKDILSLTVKKKQYCIHSLRRALKNLKTNDMFPKLNEQKLRELCSRRWFKGSSSYYLTEELNVNDIVKFNIKPSKFVLPENIQSSHIIMIATGAGIAPFKAFLSEFIYYDQQIVKDNFVRKGKRILFYGCRKREVDFLYEMEIMDALDKKHIDETYFAFSRDQESKIYVQDLILQKKELVWNLLQKGAYIYVCGNSNMSKDVNKTINSLPLHFKQNDKKFTKKLKKSGRYIYEIW
ncbi:hypothetical protein PFAG_02481 [Plasmodium falciparum Santa Lucia]|uniref:NADPH--hemoprotein reductase n=12 Tax=Plasmodium falciparum TaxID=5833 RepID=C0H553_PLAF7|nr:nitric oxide synthase, putative [Plasmodium falciparum 3D7]ETW18640.1 hypothetical protein PFFVO_02536 [Plasmodium falciparum Vietnam Oak-Knoll (FVO)]ETW27474.1 hypothetical protein PFFCH_05076 [Plasmodium falciparum FCH/4]ETW36747.1 hypothetical protein PFTANZ_02570 [Plasmodium falciparum Tanzania (2000708)]ETW43181.1 hypothetical protein PFNF135_02655 [Plasmodium falciparum NF135/5.C10]ETW49429.1 hypothetical protein PFMALIP_02520 [Plasmodium falciparum MaliPS096_E11]EUR72479.1 hypotheti|eukprot:XP_002808949.1 nitric oxide synthase, putative [Plasmodium falciparum 3D7]